MLYIYLTCRTDQSLTFHTRAQTLEQIFAFRAAMRSPGPLCGREMIRSPECIFMMLTDIALE